MFFEDPIWPQQIDGDGLLDEGFCRAERWLRPAQHADAARMTKYKVLEAAATDLGHQISACPLTVSFEDTVNPAGVATASVHLVRRLLRGLQCWR